MIADYIDLAAIDAEADRRHLVMMAMLVSKGDWIGKELRITRADLEHPPAIVVHRETDLQTGDIILSFEASKGRAP